MISVERYSEGHDERDEQHRIDCRWIQRCTRMTNFGRWTGLRTLRGVIHEDVPANKEDKRDKDDDDEEHGYIIVLLRPMFLGESVII